MACYTEIFQENISREDVADRQILDGIAPVYDGTDSFGLIGFLQEDIQRCYPALNIDMVDCDTICFNSYRIARLLL